MKYVIANWKMNMNVSDVKTWVENYENIHQKDSDNVAVILAPTSVHVPLIAEGLERFSQVVSLAVQDISANEKGAHTGDTGAFQAKDFATYAIVGHSERKEDRELVYKKRDVCLAEGIIPIVCFTTPEQLEETYTEGAILAWEDPDNISKGGVYNEKDPQEIVKAFENFEKRLPDAPILYGGSVNRQNVDNLVKIANVAGVLLGTASLDPEHFEDIVRAFS